LLDYAETNLIRLGLFAAVGYGLVIVAALLLTETSGRELESLTSAPTP
jgi:hypothetical protein